MEYINDFRPEFCLQQFSFTKNFSDESISAPKKYTRRFDDEELVYEKDLEYVRKSIAPLRDDK